MTWRRWMLPALREVLALTKALPWWRYKTVK